MDNKLLICSHSGGLDSSTVIAKAIAEGYIVQPVNFLYGQRNEIEETAQFNVWVEYKQRYQERIRDCIQLDIGTMLGSFKEQYQKIRDNGSVHEKTELEFYTPFRNLVFSSICAMVGEIQAMTEDINEIAVAIGVHKHSSESYKKDYWDITPEFVNRLNSIFELNDGLKVTVYAPYANLYKEAIIKDAIDLDVPYKLTWSCYSPVTHEFTTAEGVESVETTPCLKCEACLEREIQGSKVGVDDINDYRIVKIRIKDL